MMNRRGISMVEALLSIVVIAGLGLAAINAVSRVADTRQRSADAAMGQWIAQHLMSEIMSRPFNGVIPVTTLGPSNAEKSQPNRVAWDDVDDYDTLDESPPRDAMNNAIVSDGEGWRRTTRVTYFAPDELAEAFTTNRRCKLIEVTVWRNGRPVMTLSRLRTDAHDQAIMNPPSRAWSTTGTSIVNAIGDQP